MSAPTENIVARAKALLELESGSEELLSAFEAYTQEMDTWLEYAEPLLAGNSSELSAGDAAEVLALHEQVLNRAHDLKAGTKEEIANMKQKGKGLLAYTEENLPKRVSTGKGRKG